MAGFVVKLHVLFTVDRNIVIPPFSAKVSKLILHRISRLYSRLSRSDKVLKPVSVSPLFKDGRALMKLRNDEGMIMLEGGTSYYFSCGMIAADDFLLDDLLSFESGCVDGVFGASAILKEMRVEVRRFDSFGFPKPGAVKLRFNSPTLIQLPTFGRFRKGRYIFFPIPSLIVGSLAELWNSSCGIEHIIKSPSYLAVYSNYALMEADYSVKPVTVIYDDQRLVRGIMGWVLYDLRKCRNTKSLKRIMALLDYAQYVGVGKSRAAGFGQVSVNPIY
ncbi:hypothetical protein HRbin01_01607 [archaeon HR01]|nr:hypothetical protein HRbin01_01607 [archaeon HR01]